MKVPSFDELDADQLKELIQSGSGKKSAKKSARKSRKLPLKEKKSSDEYNAGVRVLEVDIESYKL
ncbi:MAG: hypothetical protein HOK41_18580 [Nitrospina sp.]|jgi:hypothetical protein|nr:hypothetical protein [Nitrospina sp.]MBT6717408.1 hypothetical protein [Nitrospina sp.]